MKTPIQPTTVTETLALRVERKQSQRLTIASTVSLTANALFLVLAATGMNGVHANPTPEGKIPPYAPVTFVTAPEVEEIVKAKEAVVPKKVVQARETPVKTEAVIPETIIPETVTKPQRQQNIVATVAKQVDKTVTETAAVANGTVSTATQTQTVENTNTEAPAQETGKISIAENVAGAADTADFTPATPGGATGTVSALRPQTAQTTVATGVGLAGVRGNVASANDFSGGNSIATGISLGGDGRPSLGSFGNKGAGIGGADAGSGAGHEAGVTGAGLATGGGGGGTARTFGNAGAGVGVGGNVRGTAPMGMGDGIGNGVKNPFNQPGGDGNALASRIPGVQGGSGTGKPGAFAVKDTERIADIRRNEYTRETKRVGGKDTGIERSEAHIVTGKMIFSDNPGKAPITVTDPHTKPTGHIVALPKPTVLDEKVDQTRTLTAIIDARIVRKAKPTITEEMKAAGVRPVRVVFTIKPDGTATYRIAQSSGNAELDAAVEAACVNCRWTAATRGGNPVVSTQTVTFDPNK